MGEEDHFDVVVDPTLSRFVSAILDFTKAFSNNISQNLHQEIMTEACRNSMGRFAYTLADATEKFQNLRQNYDKKRISDAFCKELHGMRVVVGELRCLDWFLQDL